MKLLSVPFALAAIITLAACNNTVGLDEKVNVSVSQTSYQAGATATVTVTNRSDDVVADPAYTCNYPALVLQSRGSNNQWTNITSVESTDTACALVLVVLPSGESRSLTFNLPSNLAAGTYRFTLYHGSVASPSFTVSN